MTQRLTGSDLAKRIRVQVSADAEQLRTQGVVPKVAITLATEDGSARWYAGSIVKAAKKVGIEADVIELSPTVREQDFSDEVRTLAANNSIHGLIVQTPLPETISLSEIAPLVPVAKDVDGINPVSAGQLAIDGQAFAPATAAAVVELLKNYDVPLSGQHVVVIGRSNVVGKPVAQLLLRENATVTIAHSRTTHLPELTQSSDVLVVAIGRAEHITGDYVNNKTVVIDVGTNTTDDDQLVGDVQASTVDGKAAALTPVPGGIGPVTTAILLRNVIQAASR